MRISSYAKVVGQESISQLHQLAEGLQGRKVVHVNSTRYGGGVAEILAWLTPLMSDLGLEVSWEVIVGNDAFFQATKKIHNGLQGFHEDFTSGDIAAYDDVTERNAQALRERLCEADFVFIHDPQPAGLLAKCPERQGKWVWRCHVDASRPHRAVWRWLEPIVGKYDASIFSMPQFARAMPHPQFLIAPSIDPLSDKNCPLTEAEIRAALDQFGLDPKRPILTQVSRFDRFKDPIGVIRAFRMLRTRPRPQLVLAGGAAADDPEGGRMFGEVRACAGDDPDIHVLSLAPDAHLTINALQRASFVIIQKSTREGFGLTVTEGLWKGKPVIGGDTGGIRLQVHDFHTGFLVNTPEGAALRIRYLLQHPRLYARMAAQAHGFVRDNFLVTRHLREYLALMLSLQRGGDPGREIPL